MNKIITITQEEAVLIDWVLTMHTFDFSLLNFLKEPHIAQLRDKAGQAILNEETTNIEFTEDEINLLLVIVPTTFRFAQNDVGFTLKAKLFNTKTEKKAKPDLSMLEEKKDATDQDGTNENNPHD